MINTYNESSLHKTLKDFYSAQQPSRQEVELEGHIYDILTDNGNVIEIQTQSISKLTEKIKDTLEKGHECKIVHPLVIKKEILLQDKDGTKLSLRKSPKKNSVYDIFRELTGIYPLLSDKKLSIEILFIEMTEIRTQTEHPVQSENKRRRFKKDWIKTDKKLKEILDSKILSGTKSYAELLPKKLPPKFTVKDIENLLKENKNLPKSAAKNASIMIWVLSRMNIIICTGKKGRTKTYRLSEQLVQPEQYGYFS